MTEDKRLDKDREDDSVLFFYKGISGSALTLQGATKEGVEAEGGRREREEKCRETDRGGELWRSREEEIT